MTALAGLATGDNTELFDLHVVKWLFINLECENLGGERSLKCNLKGYSKGHVPLKYALANMCSRVSQKNQKSEFFFATNPSGFHRLDEPPEKISAL